MYRLIRNPFCFFMLLLSLSSSSVWADSGQRIIGTPATQQQIAGWDIDVRPDGKGLPKGKGSVAAGELLFEGKCASCHGSFGEGNGRWPVLAGGQDTLTEDRPEKTVGSYWPYVSTLWDYIHRAMPFLQPQSLTDNEVYAIVAYVLYLNEIVEDDFVLTHKNLVDIRLMNEVSFVDDPRPDVHNKRCMKDCRDPQSIKITWDSTNLGVTPVDHLAGDKEVKQEKNKVGETIYKANCGACHDYGAAGAPIIGEASQWQDRIKQTLDVLYHHAINGYQGNSGYMPAKGGNTNLSDVEVKAAVEHMIELVGQ